MALLLRALAHLSVLAHTLERLAFYIDILCRNNCSVSLWELIVSDHLIFLCIFYAQPRHSGVLFGTGLAKVFSLGAAVCG